MILALIDDDLLFAKTFTEKIASGDEVRAFASSRTALENSESLLQCDAIIIDVHLKDDTGFGVLDKLKIRGPIDPAVLFLTEDRSEETKILGLRLGVSDFLSKSMNPEELRLRIHNAVNVRRESLRPRIGNLVLDQDRLSCSIEEISEEIAITKLEFQILRQIFRARAGILKADLEHALWKNTLTVPNTLNTHIHNLNSKLSAWSHSLRINREGLVEAAPKTERSVGGQFNKI